MPFALSAVLSPNIPPPIRAYDTPYMTVMSTPPAKTRLPPLPTSSLGSRPVSNSSSPSKLTPRKLGDYDDGFTPRSRTPNIKTPNSARSIKSEESTLEYELEDLRNEIRHKNNQIGNLTKEINTLKRSIVTKDETIEEMESKLDTADEQLLQNQGDMVSLNRQLQKLQAEHARMESQMMSAVDEADRLNKLMLSHSGNSAKALNEAAQDIARLQNELSQARKELARLTEDNRSCYKQIKAKDRAIELQAAKVAQAEEILSNQKEEQNQIVQLRRQLVETQATIRGCDAMQAACGQEAISAIQGHKKVASDLESTKRYLNRVKADLEASQDMLKHSQARVGELEGELSRMNNHMERFKKETRRKYYYIYMVFFERHV